MASTMNLLSLQKSLFLGQNNVFNHTNKPFFSTQKLRSNHAVNTTAKLSIFEIFGGRGLCNGEEGLQQELKKTVSQEPSSSVLEVQEESRIENIPEDGFDKELLGLTGGFPGGEKGLQAFIAKNPPPEKPLPSEKLVETNEKSLTKKSKPPALPLLMPGGNWDRLITFKLDELERREKGPPMVSCRSVLLESMVEEDSK
ncbi:Chlororespiratory reduction31 [Heracleum sosnowskyi]|uniref:Chlororespiratory reduction31 n=1 Tax=Heracleum sosnowskyi TaxID=360622 RepID=A0AAD8JBD2_9APIA|nr:Chlororespiratory reduction31 [Heracleum sosnowskyi]